MHHIQQSILTKLASESPLSFSQIQPKNTPNNIFAYHLKRLVDTGYVLHKANKYEITRKAMKIYHFDASPPSEKSNYPRLVTIIYVTNTDGKVLIQKRDRLPFRGWYGLPSGLVHYGENIEEAASRELEEKTGITIRRNLTKAGIIDFRYSHNETKDIFVHAIGLIFTYIKTTEIKLPDDCKWSDLSEKDILPEVFTVRDIVEQKLPFITSYEFNELKT